MITMDWIKKNWIMIAIAILIIAVIIFFARRARRRKASTPARTALGGRPAGGPSIKDQLAECEKNTQNVRLIPGAPHPCAALRDAAAKESAYFAQQLESAYGGNIDEKINVVDYAIGGQGMSMLEEKNFHLPTFKVRPSASESKYDEGRGLNVMESNYNGLSTTNGLNVVDFAAGLEGTSLLLDKQM